MAALAAGGGCLAGTCLTGVALWAKDSRANSKGRGKGPTLPLPVPQPSPFGRFTSAPWSPLKNSSPTTHLRREEGFSLTGGGGNGSGPRLNPDVSLTKKPAEFRYVAGMKQSLDQDAFIKILRKLIGEAKHLQNNPRLDINPEETRAAKIVMDQLAPYTQAKGGPLIMEELTYVKGRSNLKVVYPGTGEKTVSFVGSHFDVVPADPETWDKDPFSLTIEGDKLYGRGTTDCLGHVALITQFLVELAKARPRLTRTLIVVFIAGEEGGVAGIGVDKVVEAGKLAEAKNGPVYWVDSADSQPCCGTSGMMAWSLKCKGRLIHSGFPQKGINSIELANQVCSYVQQRFYEDFPPLAAEEAYGFSSGSNMKPTQIECAKGSMNQICPETTVSGDIRLSPFYDVEDVKSAIEGYVSELNHGAIDLLPTLGSWSKYELAPDVPLQPGELRRGVVELKWQGDMDTFKLYAGFAAKLDSEGHKALVQACREARNDVKPFSVNGSLPLVKMMQKEGFDIQLCGFGLMSVYHGVNEYCTMDDMVKAYEVMLRVLCLLEA